MTDNLKDKIEGILLATIDLQDTRNPNSVLTITQLESLFTSLIQQEREKALKEFVDFIQQNIGYADLRGLSLLVYEDKFITERFLKESTNVQHQEV